MSSKREADSMGEQLAERLELEKAEMVDEVEFELDPAPVEEWSEGVEHLKKKTPEELYQMLGLEKASIPFFKEKSVGAEQEVSGELGEVETSATTTEGFSLRWHQLAGLVRMLERARTSQPVLLMDDVGLGKTVQVLALFAMLAYYRVHYKTQGRYPGLWGE
jgi:SNF2 family DNA or RNA helicase